MRVVGSSLTVWSGGFGAVGWTSGGSDFANLCSLRRTLKVNQDLGEWIPTTTSSACWKHTPRCMTLTTTIGCKKSSNRIRCCSSIRQRRYPCSINMSTKLCSADNLGRSRKLLEGRQASSREGWYRALGCFAVLSVGALDLEQSSVEHPVALKLRNGF